MPGWRRPFFDTRAFPHDIWAMAQPLLYNDTWLWVGSGHVWGVPKFRLAGLNTVSNAEFTTATFSWPTKPSSLWVNADASWGEKPELSTKDWCPGGCNGVGGSDEARAAYLMFELLDAENSKTIPGFEQNRSLITNASGPRLPITWANKEGGVLVPGTPVKLRVYMRDATVYAIGAH